MSTSRSAKSSRSSPTKSSTKRSKGQSDPIPLSIPSISSSESHPIPSSSTIKGLGRRSSPTKIVDQQSTIFSSSSKSSQAIVKEESLITLDSLDQEENEIEIEEDEDVPVRKAGFGKIISTTTSIPSSTTVTDLPTRMAEEEEEDEEEEEMTSKEQNVVVCVRVRPTRSDAGAGGSSIYKFLGAEGRIKLDASHPTFMKRGGMSKGATANIQAGEYDFRFDALHLSPAPTESLYDLKIRQVIRAAMEGFNGTVFAYGQTASGKTHTMMGNEQEIGIIPLAIQELFSFILKQDTLRTFSLRVSFLEIYKEAFSDLLVSTPRPASAKPLEVHDEGMVHGLIERPVSSPDDVMRLLEEGEKRRRVGMTDWNDRSSRSHCVFIVTIESSCTNTGGAARRSRLNLIDLAGSESATGQADRQKEGAYINKSLLTLGTVIAKLTEPQGTSSHIPFRDSKLTRLLQPALSGKSRVAIICTISPDAEQATETLSTLKFAKRAKLVVTKAERNVLVSDRMMLQNYATEVEKLKRLIAAGENAVADGEMARERDSARAQVGELTTQKDLAEAELARKELELNQLKEQLEHTTSFLLTGPVLEANTRRTSGGFSLMNGSGSTPGRRNISEMSALGLGTPRGRIVSAVGRELALEVELEQAKKQLSSLQEKDDELSTLRDHVNRLKASASLARLDAAAGEDGRQNDVNALEQVIEDLKSEINDLRAEYEKTTGEEEKKTKTKVEELEARVSTIQLEATTKSQHLADAIQKLCQLETTGATSEKKVVELQSSLKLEKTKRKKLEGALALAAETTSTGTARLGESHRVEIEAYRAEIEALKEELSNLRAQHLLEMVALGTERDLALDTTTEAIEQLAKMEAMNDGQQRELLSLQERLNSETTPLLLTIGTLEAEAVESKKVIASLYQALAAHKKADTVRSKYVMESKNGTNGLKNKIAEMTARSTSSSSNVHSVSSFEGSRSLRSSTSSRRESSDEVMVQKNEELQGTNAELVKKVASLEAQLRNTSSTTKEMLSKLLEEKEGSLEESRREADEWKEMFLETQRAITTAARPRLAEVNNISSRPPLPHPPKVSYPSSPTSYTASTTLATAPRARQLSNQPIRPSSPSSAYNFPPPLPYSPRNQEAARRLRRETLDKELGQLQASHSVERSKELLRSPGTSPTKVGMMRSETRLGRKGENDSAKYWS